MTMMIYRKYSLIVKFKKIEMKIIGIDPGLKGAVAFLKKGKIINLFECQ